ncbi:hypothetical protein [Neobacillus sp. SuZ13]|uniref:hypothetical protein n=1 Tax=Neobacillus sp. SuZ13 TaxID=3047875 RepID=UPI0024C09D6F|nr:hypothetical protein [Neobacillus sp. SuZ13]WHY65364.1 hypothetical protein QNH17_20030 [Neobacillus sp. SuZ13]
MNSLTHLISNYKRNKANFEVWKLSDFRNRSKSIEELINDAVWGYLPDRKRDGHQRRIDKGVLDEMVKKLLDPAVLDELKDRCKSFDDFFSLVYSLKIKGFSSLCVYDTALRIGAIFNYYPDVVFLHCGALEGAVALIGKEKLNRYTKYFADNGNYPYLPVECLPKELQVLEPHHIENFLCINKKKIIPA